MRRLSLLVVLAAGAVALAAPTLPSNFSEVQACSVGVCARSAPTSTAEGATLYTVKGFRLSICAASGQTLSGAGTMLAYFCDSVTSLCMRNPALDQIVTATSRCQVFADFVVGEVTYNADTVVFAASGVTVSGGATLTARIYPYVGR